MSASIYTRTIIAIATGAAIVTTTGCVAATASATITGSSSSSTATRCSSGAMVMRIKSSIVQQIRYPWGFWVQHIVFGYRLNRTIVVSNPATVASVENVGDIMTLGCFLSIVIYHREQLILLLFGSVRFALRGHQFCKSRHQISVKIANKLNKSYLNRFSIRSGTPAPLGFWCIHPFCSQNTSDVGSSR